MSALNSARKVGNWRLEASVENETAVQQCPVKQRVHEHGSFIFNVVRKNNCLVGNFHDREDTERKRNTRTKIFCASAIQ